MTAPARRDGLDDGGPYFPSRSAHFFSSSVRRKRAFAPEKSICDSLRMATAEWSMGTDTLASTDETMSAS